MRRRGMLSRSSHEERESQDGANYRRHLSRWRLWGPLAIAWIDKMVIGSAAISMYAISMNWAIAVYLVANTLNHLC